MRPANKKLWLGSIVLAAAILMLDLAVPLGVAGGVPYITVVLLSLWSPRRRLTVIAALVGSILTVVGFYLSPPGGIFWKVIVNRVLAILAIWITALLILVKQKTDLQREAALLDRERALADLKILRGLLPICASCKKVRDDKGYWNHIETYIHEHSEADFSHGLCPDCAARLYPEMSEEAAQSRGSSHDSAD